MAGMTEKISVSVTEEHARLLHEAVNSGDYASSSEVVREALREWKTRRLLGRMWDEGIASGPCEPGTTMDEIKAEARRRQGVA
jgi:antitoxin ParD1/3/4